MPSPRQERLAKLDPADFESHTERLIAAGYSPKTARSSALAIREAKGVQRARERVERRKLDNAGRVKAILGGLLDFKASDLDNLDAAQKLILAGQAAKLLQTLQDTGQASEGKKGEHIDWYVKLARRFIAIGIGFAWRSPVRARAWLARFKGENAAGIPPDEDASSIDTIG